MEHNVERPTSATVASEDALTLPTATVWKDVGVHFVVRLVVVILGCLF